MWDPDGENSLACDEHAVEARTLWGIHAEHPVGAVCSMPGATWDHDKRRCLIEGIDAALPELVAMAGRRPPLFEYTKGRVFVSHGNAETGAVSASRNQEPEA